MILMRNDATQWWFWVGGVSWVVGRFGVCVGIIGVQHKKMHELAIRIGGFSKVGVRSEQ